MFSTGRKLLSDFKTAGLNRSPTPPVVPVYLPRPQPSKNEDCEYCPNLKFFVFWSAKLQPGHSGCDSLRALVPEASGVKTRDRTMPKGLGPPTG